MGHLRVALWLRTISLVAAYLCAVLVIYRFVLANIFRTGVVLGLALALVVVQLVVMALLLSVWWSRKVSGQFREKRLRRLFPVIREKLATYAIGHHQLSGLRHLYRSYPAEFEACLADFLPSIAGEGNKRLSQLAIDLGMVRKWEQQARARSPIRREEAIRHLCRLSASTVRLTLIQALSDSELEIRVEACRALIRLSQPEELNRLFNYAIEQPPLVCSILLEDLRPYALLLTDGAIRDGLRSPEVSQLLATLGAIGSWRRVLPLPEVAELLRHSNPKVQAAAFQVLDYVACDVDAVPAVLEGLDNPDPWVKITSARASGRLKLEAAVPILIRFLRDPHKGVARAAAYALCELGADGMKILVDEINSTNQTAAQLALEALECIKVGRYEYVGVE